MSLLTFDNLHTQSSGKHYTYSFIMMETTQEQSNEEPPGMGYEKSPQHRDTMPPKPMESAYYPPGILMSSQSRKLH